MKKLHLREVLNEQSFESIIVESARGRPDIEESAREIFEAMREFERAAMDGNDIITEATKLSSGEITKLFKAASNASKGLDPATKEPGMMSKLAGKVKGAVAGSKVGQLAGKAKEALGKLNAVVKKASGKLQDSQPVQNFDIKVDQVLGKWKESLGSDHKAVKLAKQLGDFGKKNPKKSAFIIATLAGLASFAGSPAAGMALGTALRTAAGLAQGERASTAVGKAAKVAAIGAGIGAAAGVLGDMFQGAEVTGATVDPAEAVKQAGGDTGGDAGVGRSGVSDDFAGRMADRANLLPGMKDRYVELISSGEKFHTIHNVPISGDEYQQLHQATGKPGMNNMKEVNDWLMKNVDGAQEGMDKQVAAQEAKSAQFKKDNPNAPAPTTDMGIDLDDI
jgi:hypothetical protein